jgi:methionyl-tRNA formyltransferase
VGFAGTPAFAARALEAIHAHGYTIPVVLTQPDRPSGRGLALASSPVKRFAMDHGFRVLQPRSLRDEAAHAALAGVALDVLVVAAYGLILPQAVLDWPRHGCLNIHASLLPRWRGAAPIARAIEAGDRTSGITIMRMDAGLDTGPVVREAPLEVDPRETTGSLTDRLATLGAATIVDVLGGLVRDGSLAVTAQPARGATYAAKITRADARLDWAQDATTLDRRIRALSPSPGAAATWRGRPVKILAAVPADSRASVLPGTVVGVGAQGLDVACGDESVLRVTRLQPAAGKPMPARAFAAGYRAVPGTRFEPGPTLP